MASAWPNSTTTSWYSGSSWWRQWQSYCVLALAIACYLNAAHCGFVFDDISAIVENKDITPDVTLWSLFSHDFWGTPMDQERSHKSYRPLCVLTFRLNYYFGELDPFGYHLMNIMLHAGVSLLFMRTCRLMLVDPLCCFIASVVFAVHPVHTEAVTGVVGRAELLAAFFCLLALQAYIASVPSTREASGGQRPANAHGVLAYIVVPLCIAAATFSKEQGITVIGVCTVYEVCIVQKVSLPCLSGSIVGRQAPANTATASSHWSGAVKRLMMLAVTAVLLLWIRLYIMGSRLPVFTGFDNPAAAAATPARQLTYNYLLPVNAWLLLNPSHLCCDWTMGTIALVESISDLRNLATVALYVVLGKLVLSAMASSSEHSQRIAMSLAFIVMPFLPASNLLFPVGFVVAERVLYMPSMGYAMLLATAIKSLLARLRSRSFGRHILFVMVGCLLLMFASKTFIRNYDWKDEYTLFTAALRTNSNNAKIYNNIGHSLDAEKRYSEALQYFQVAARKQPDDIGSHINVGRTYVKLEQPTDAERAFRVALSLMPAVRPGHTYTTRVPPNHLNVYLNLANLISRNASRLLEADALYRTALSMRADFVQAYINRGDILLRLQRPVEAAEQYRLALAHRPANADDVYYNLGVVHISMQQMQEAFTYFEKAISVNPNHKLALYNSAVMIQETGDAARRRQAVERLLHLLRLDPMDEKAHFSLGMLATDDKNYKDAELHFLSAIELKQDFRGALFNLALMLANDLQRPLDAKPHLETCLRHHPDHVKSLLLLGDINLTYLNDTAAAENNFRAILVLEPGHVQAEHNLCVVLVHRGNLAAAERCLLNIIRRAPGQSYIADHLAVVRARLHEAKAAAGAGHSAAP